MQASVAAALSRDVVFGRPAPATYCLASFLTAAALYDPSLLLHCPCTCLRDCHLVVLQASLVQPHIMVSVLTHQLMTRLYKMGETRGSTAGLCQVLQM